MKLRPPVSFLLAALAVAPLSAQTAPAAKDDIVALPAFSINAEKDTGYTGTSSLSSTRIAVDLSELPQSVKVLNNSFLKAVNPFMLTDILNYTGGAQNGQLNWTPGRLNIRGYTGDGDYNDSFGPPPAPRSTPRSTSASRSSRAPRPSSSRPTARPAAS